MYVCDESLSSKPLIISSEDLEEGDPQQVDVTANKNIPDPNDLVGFTYVHDNNGNPERAVVKERIDDEQYRVELIDRSHAVVEYNILLDNFNSANDEGDQIFTFWGFLDHKKKKNQWQVLVDWEGVGYEPTWEPLKNMKEADLVTCAKYAKTNNLENTPGWKWTKRFRAVDSSRFIRTARRICKASRTEPKFKFGVQVPRNVKEALELDRKNGNDLWKVAIDKEIT